LVKSFDCDGKGESENGKRENNASPEEGEGESSLRRLVRFDGFSSGPVSHVADKVRCVHDTGNFNGSGNPVGEGHEVVVDVVKHHVGSVTLRSQLSNNNVLQDHSKTGSEEEEGNPVRKSKNFSALKRSSAKSNGEVDEDNHELTSHEVTIEVVSLVSPSGDLVGDRVGFAVELAVDRRKTNHGALSSLNHGHPDDESPHDDSSSDRVDITGDLGVSSGDQSQDNNDGEDKKKKRIHNSDLIKGGVNPMGFRVGGHGEGLCTTTAVECVVLELCV